MEVKVQTLIVENSSAATQRWSKPPPSCLKCNTDAVVFIATHSVGFGVVIPDSINAIGMGIRCKNVSNIWSYI